MESLGMEASAEFDRAYASMKKDVQTPSTALVGGSALILPF